MSMVPIDINLIRERVIPRPQRKTLFVVMSLYVLVSGLVMTLVTYRSVVRFNDARLLHASSSSLSRQFHAGYPSSRNMVAFAQGQRMHLTQEADVLEGIGGTLSRYVPLPHILKGLELPLPYMTHVTDLSFDSQGGQLTFTITTPANVTRPLTAGQLLIFWREQPLLGHYLSGLTADQSTRTRQDNQLVLAHRFSATTVRQNWD